MTDSLSLATDVAGIRERLGRMFTEESRAQGDNYKATPTDVIISTFPKCGTTLTQQIVHGLRTRGDMDFDEITDVVPWLETSLDMGVDIYAPQKAEPKAFKSHQTWEEVPKGARYIYVLRDPKDVAVSFYHFFRGWLFEPSSMDINQFVEEFVLEGTRSGRYAIHLNSWWHKRNDADTLMMCFEDMTADLRGAVSRIAEFIGAGTDAESIDIATRQADIKFMRAHPTQFDDHPIRIKRNEIAGLPPDASSTKVRDGSTGSHSVLSAHLLERFDDIWANEIAPVTGHPDYPSLRAELAPN